MASASPRKTNQSVTYTDAYQTRADVYTPNAAAGPCGWPLLVAVHGFTGSKQSVASRAADLAALGYMVVAYDVRGQGSTVALNPGNGTGLMSLAEWIDMFEMIEWVEATYGNLVDTGRVGVFGISQGGAHAWAAAAWSGRTPPPNPRRSAPFPIIKAVAVTAMLPSHTQVTTVGGTAFKAIWPRYGYNPNSPTLAFDPAVSAAWRGFLDNDDPEGNHQWMLNDPGRDFITELAASSVATLVMLSWRDNGAGGDTALAALQSMPTSTPKRLYLSTGQHGTPQNDYQASLQLQLRARWFARFLKDDPEPIEQGPTVLSAALPGDATTYNDPTALWRHRADAALPPTNAVTTSYFLRSAGALSTQAPTANEPADRIVHSVPPGYTALQWGQSGGGVNASAMFAQMPLSDQVYTTPPFPDAIEIAGTPMLELRVTPLDPRFFVAARLDVLPPSGGELTVGRGATGIRQPGSPTATTLRLGLDLVDVVVPAGSRLRLSVRNHFLVRSGQNEAFHTMPYLTNYTVDVEHSPGALSFLELPTRPAVALDVSTASTMLSTSAPLPIDLTLRSSPDWAGSIYFLALTQAGQGPAIPLPGGGALYLQPDGLTFASLGGGAPLLPGFVGLLDANGDAAAGIDLQSLAPLSASFAGTNLHFAPLALVGTDIAAGAPLFVEFLP